MSLPLKIDRKLPDWLIIFAVCVPAFANGGENMGMSLFFKPLQESFGWSAIDTSSGYTAFKLCLGVAMLTAGFLLDRYGYRPVAFLTACSIGFSTILLSFISNINQFRFLMAIAGFGTGACFIVPTTVVQQWFTEERGKVLGFVSAAMGTGVAVVPPILNHFIYSYGWRTGYWILGSYFFITIIVATLVIGNVARVQRPGHKEEYTVNTTAPVWKLRQAIKTAQFFSIAAGGCLALTSLSMVHVHLVPFAINTGISPTYAAIAITVMGAMGIPLRFSLGKIVQRLGWFRLLIISPMLWAIANIILINMGNSLPLFYFAVALIGCGMALLSPSIPGILGTYFGMQSLGTIIGFNQGISNMISGIAGPLLGGASYDLTQSYRTAFLVAIGLLITSIAFFMRARHHPVTRDFPVKAPGA